MHEVENWPADVTVAEPQARVVVGGREQKVLDYSLTKSLGDSLSGGDGLVATTGDVTIVDQSEVVSERRVTPWSPLAVRRGDAVTMRAGYEGALAPQLVGVVDGTSGGANKETRLELVDHYEALQLEVTKDPLLASMPPYIDGGAFRHVGLTPTYVTSMLLRECGFYATPPHRFGAAVNVPMNGSMWPEYASTVLCSRIGDSNELPDFEQSPWGQAVKNVTASYYPSPFNHVGRPFEMQMLVGEAGSSGTVIVAAHYGSQYVRVTVGSSRNVSFQVNTGSGNTTVASLSSSQMVGATMISARVSGSTWTLTADNGQVSSGSRSWPWSSMYDRVGVNVPANAAQIGGLMVGYMETPVTSFTPSARLTPSAFPRTLGAMPAIVRQRVANLLREQAAAELASFWIDDQGVFQWRNRYQLTGGTPVYEVTSTENLLDLSWRERSATTTKTIKVSGKVPIPSVAQRATITLYEGRSDSLDSQQEKTIFMEPSADEDWVSPDMSAEWLTADAERAPGFSRGRRTWIGMVRVNENADNESVDHWISGSDQSVQKIDPRTFLVSLKAPAYTGDQTVELRSHKSDGRIWEQRRNSPLPVLRGYGHIAWVDQEQTRAGEPNGLQEYSHDVGWWVQHSTAIEGVANALEQRLLNPHPVLDDVPIVPDTRLELGDIITLRDEHITGLNLRCLIEGIKLSGAEGEQDQTLTLRILAVNGRDATYAELERAWTTGGYTGLENEWSGENYSHFENNPTRRG